MRSDTNNTVNTQNLYNQCKKMMNYHVILRMQDGSEVDGIIESVDPNGVNVLVGEDVMVGGNGPGMEYNAPGMEYNAQRQFGNPVRYRRFRRRNFPLATLLALSLLPYPYYAPPFPFFPY